MVYKDDLRFSFGTNALQRVLEIFSMAMPTLVKTPSHNQAGNRGSFLVSLQQLLFSERRQSPEISSVSFAFWRKCS